MGQNPVLLTVDEKLNGFIIRLSPIKSALRRQPRPVYGRSYGPYWQHYFVVYDNYEKHMRLDILYGIRTDKKLLEEVTDSVEKMFGKPERF